jgi:hypothetical protein
MRGCLFVLIVAALFVVGLAWFAGPPIASALVGTTLTAAGLNATDLDVRVEADPPVLVAIGQADRVTIEGTDVDWDGLEARSIALTLTDASLIGPSAAEVEGRLVGVELPGIDPPGSLADVAFEGPFDAATTTVTIDGETVESMALAAFENTLGVRPDGATLSEPNVIRIRAGPVEVAGALTIGPGGTVDVTTPLGTATIVEPDPALPVELASVAVEGDELVLTGTIDLGELLR